MQTPAPAYVAPADPRYGVLREIVIKSGGLFYHITTSVTCRLDSVQNAHGIMQVPSRKIVLFLECDGPTALDQVDDEPSNSEAKQPIKKR